MFLGCSPVGFETHGSTARCGFQRCPASVALLLSSHCGTHFVLDIAFICFHTMIIMTSITITMAVLIITAVFSSCARGGAANNVELIPALMLAVSISLFTSRAASCTRPRCGGEEHLVRSVPGHWSRSCCSCSWDHMAYKIQCKK